jgi:hypothetical protein
MKSVLVYIALILCVPATTLAQTTPQTYQVKEAYEIYATLLPIQWPVTEARAKTLIIRAETTSYEMCLRPEGESAAILGPVIANFAELNKQTWLLDKAIPMEQPYEFVFGKELDAIFADGPAGWKGFYEKYPDSGGYNEVSAVGFNSDKTIAIVYVAHMCGGLCGGGSFHVLEKKDGKWQAHKWKGSECTWVS